MPEHQTAATAGTPHTSESEEMYLITILRAVEEGHEGPVGLAALAERLEVTAASANEMIRKMEGRGLVTYEPYKGASATPVGVGIGSRVLRTRRLWARFLVDHLGFTPRQADALACDLEHATSAETADRLDEFLGHPECDPLGAPIPGGRPAGATRGAEPLSAVPMGVRAEVVVAEAGPEEAGFLTASGLRPGAMVAVTASGPGGVLVETAEGAVHLGTGLAGSVMVRREGGADAS